METSAAGAGTARALPAVARTARKVVVNCILIFGGWLVCVVWGVDVDVV